MYARIGVIISFLVNVADSVVLVRVLSPVSPVTINLSPTVVVGIYFSSVSLVSPVTVTVPSAAISTFPLLTKVVTSSTLSGSSIVKSMKKSGFSSYAVYSLMFLVVTTSI